MAKALTPTIKGKTVELGFDAEVREAPLDEGSEIGCVVAVGGVRREPSAGLGGDEERLRSFAAEAGNEALGEAIAVDVGGVEEVDAGVEGRVEGSHRLGLVGPAPLAAADGPGTEADFRNVPAGSTERACFHGG